MSAEVETMAWTGEKPWHSLGVEVPNDLTPAQMLKKAGLDWKVEKVPLFAEYKGESIETGKEALMRNTDSSVLSVISDDWEPVQNEVVAEFFHDFVMKGDMNMETAGALKNGKMVWFLAKVNDSFTILGRDKIESYLLFSNPHEYGKSVSIKTVMTRCVCWNTVTAALAEKTVSSVRLNHRKIFDPEMVKKTLGIAHTKMKKYEEIATFLSEKKYTPDIVEKYFSNLFPSTSKKDDKVSKAAKIAIASVETQPGADFGAGTFWQLYNAATFTVDHRLGRTQDTRLQSAWYGAGAQTKLNALNSALDLAKVA